MGLDTVTIKHRSVVVSDTEKKVLGIKGPVPGPNGSIVYVTLESATPSKK
jgi:ribosomal protein L3